MNLLKTALRQEVKAQIKKLSAQERERDSCAALKLLRAQPEWQKARSILMYAPTMSELNVWPLLGESLMERKLIALPRFDRTRDCYEACVITDAAKDVESGKYDIREPRGHCEVVALNRLDFVLVPGVAFDLHGRRLGRGRGYYDRLLAEVRGQTCGVAFDEQIVDEVPVDPHDSEVNRILTPTRWIEP